MKNSDILQTTLVGLETGLRVRHITTFELSTCDLDTNVEAVLTEPSLSAFDCIPIRSGSIIIGYIRRAPDLQGSVRQHMRPIEESVLVSADLPLTQFIPQFPSTPFRLVLDGVTIRGIVTWSDLQKLPIRLFAFSLITNLEMVMAEAIRAKYADSTDWLVLLSERRHQGIEAKRKLLQQRDLEPSLLELTDFCDKRDILAKRLGLGGQFRKDLVAIEELRNTTAHAGTYAESPEAVRQFVACLQNAERWTSTLANMRPATQHDES